MDRIRVRSLTVVDKDTGDECTADCRFVRTSCTLADVEDGEYIVDYGLESALVTLPTGPEPLFCLGRQSPCE